MFNGNYILTGKIVCETGLHIGGSNNSIEIGGSDNVVIRDSITNLPYIPGSSLKGKIRSLLELNDEEIFMNIKHNKGEPSTQGIVADVFGKASDKSEYNINTSDLTQESEDKLIQMIKDLQNQIDEMKNSTQNNETIEEKDTNNVSNHENNHSSPTAFAKLIVRDSYPTEKTIKKWNDNYEVVNGSELKYENTIDRIKCTSNPRNIERVPIESEFEFEIIYGIYNDNENEVYAKKVCKLLNKGLKLLEDNYLGGSGTRGFGRVRIDDLKLIKRDRNYYENNEEEIDITDEFINK
ncbi:MAG: type III-A CRISPR-associated RAMP protein Csm3 [Methanosphaera sp.]|nr:type III-A CRISPR-associated RAMP protein Csm3 [Methanosphaera sp.]